jgi:hypothetical protein
MLYWIGVVSSQKILSGVHHIVTLSHKSYISQENKKTQQHHYLYKLYLNSSLVSSQKFRICMEYIQVKRG